MHPFQTTLPTALLALALPLGLLATGPAAPGASESVELGHAPAEGSARKLEVSLRHRVSGGGLEVIMNGSPVPEMYLPEMELTFDDESFFAVEEAFTAAPDEAPEWLRRYTEINYTNAGNFVMTMGGETTEMPWDADVSSDLLDSVHRIASDEEGELECETIEGESAPEGLRLDLSFATLLSDGSVSVGDSWTAEGEALGFLLEPGGELGLLLPPQAKDNLFRDYDTREHGGELTLTLAAVEDGVARIEVEGELERISVGPGDLSQVPVADGAATDTTTETFLVSGELRWSTEANLLVELTLAGTFDSDTVTLRDPDLPGSTYESTFSQGGDWWLDVNATALELDETSLLEATASR